MLAPHARDRHIAVGHTISTGRAAEAFDGAPIEFLRTRPHCAECKRIEIAERNRVYRTRPYFLASDLKRLASQRSFVVQRKFFRAGKTAQPDLLESSAAKVPAPLSLAFIVAVDIAR